MPAKQLRLTKKKDFEAIFKRGRSCYGKFLGVKAATNEEAVNRYAVIVSAKVSKKAVERNKLKRQVKVLLKESDRQTVQGLDLVVMVLPAALGQSYDIIKSQLIKIFVKLKLFK